MALWTTADVLSLYNTDETVGLIKETTHRIPEIQNLFAVPVDKTYYKTLVRTELPSVGFRNSNEGIDDTHGTYTVREVQCYYADASWKIDRKVADEYDFGREMIFLNEEADHWESMMLEIAQQTWYGIANDAKGFTGIASYFPSLTAPNLVNAGGTTADKQTSVYMVYTDLQGVGYCWGRDGRLTHDEVVARKAADATGKEFGVYSQEMGGHVGLQVPSTKFIGRICNIDGTHPLTDLLLDQMWVQFGARKPNQIYMSENALVGLINWRRSYYTTPDNKVPNVEAPGSYNGVPIFTTDAIKNTESVVA